MSIVSPPTSPAVGIPLRSNAVLAPLPEDSAAGSKSSQVASSHQKWATDSLAMGVVFALLLTVGQRVIGFGRGILFCRLMTDQELGQWSMVWSFLMLLAPLAMLGLPGCLGKYTEYFRRRGQLQSFIWRVGGVSLLMALFMSTTIVAFPATFAKLLFRDASQTFVVQSLGVTLMAVAVSNFAISLMESLRQIRLVTLMRFVTGLGFAVIGTGMLVVWKNNASAVTFSYGLCCLLGIVPAVWMGWKFRSADSQPSSDLAEVGLWQRILPFAFWLWISNLLNNLFEISDRTMLIHWSGTSSETAQAMVGQYHSGRVIPLLIVSVAAMLAGVLLPYLSAAWETGRKDQAVRQLNWTYKLAGLSFTVGGLLVLITAPIFFDWILQGRYNEGRFVLPMTLVYCIWFSLFMIGQDYLWVAEKGKLATIAVAVGLIANIGLNIVLIPYLGLCGAVVATMIGNFLVMVLVVVINHYNGCQADQGIWLISLLPIVLLCSPWVACAVLIAMTWLGFRTQWIFSEEEKQTGLAAWQTCRKKFDRWLP